MKTIDSISKDYQIIEKQQGRIFGGQKSDAVVTMVMDNTYVCKNGDAIWGSDDGSSWGDVIPN